DYWSRGKQLWWIGARPGAKLTLAVPVEKSGSYEISANFTRAIDYGIVQLYLNGKKIGRPVDLYNDGVVPSGEVQFGNHELSAGENKITVEIIGANEKAQKSYMVGIDYIKLKPTQ
ncbi:MAG TPA: VCBS repeat-containing protein, partial [Armatimonadota bacterium]|nr:VCBS repeat-containing protein [Armatimonadota bacterium]